MGDEKECKYEKVCKVTLLKKVQNTLQAWILGPLAVGIVGHYVVHSKSHAHTHLVAVRALTLLVGQQEGQKLEW